MRRPPPLAEIPRFPVAGGTALLAAGVTVAHFVGKVDLSPLYADENVVRGQVWRLVTSVLPHGSPLHLIFNLMWIWSLGTLVEQELGRLRTFALFVFLGLGSSAAQYALDGGGIGLSGIVYGLWGFCFVLKRRGDPRFADATDSSTNTLFAFWFVLCIVLTHAGSMNVANTAHGAGAALGALVGMGMAVRPRTAWWALAVLFTGASVYGAMRLRPWVNVTRNGEVEAKLGYDAAVAERPADAERWYRLALKIEPTDHNTWFNLGLICGDTQRLPEAARCFERATELDPENPKYREQAEFFREYLSDPKSGSTATPQ